MTFTIKCNLDSSRGQGHHHHHHHHHHHVACPVMDAAIPTSVQDLLIGIT